MTKGGSEGNLRTERELFWGAMRLHAGYCQTVKLVDCGVMTEPGEPKMLCRMVLGRRWVAYLGCPTTANAHSLVLSVLALACGSRRRN